MIEAVEQSGRPTMVSFNYRRIPAVTLAKQLVDEGRLGRIFHYRAKYLQDWTISPDLPQGGNTLWRLDAQAAGSGVTGDLLAHSIDLAQWLAGPIAQVTAMTETFIKERPLQDDPDTVQAGGDRRRLRLPGPLRQRRAGHLRVHPLCQRAQEPEHL